MITVTTGSALLVEMNSKRNNNQNLDEVESTVKKVIQRVRMEGDSAVLEYTLAFDKVSLDELELSAAEWEKGAAAVNEEYADMLKEAIANITAYHSKQVISPFEIDAPFGSKLGQRVMPLKRVGVYVPGGTASYPSTVLMNVIPAKIAGVGEVIMVTPPDKNGKIKNEVLLAARLAGVDRIFKIGGAQAIAALAYGTQSIPMVDKIVGPGNIYVATAKRQVYGQVDIDMIAGPSEVLIIADKKGNPTYIAADMLAQAEHDKLATAILLTTDDSLPDKVTRELAVQLERLERREIAEASIRNNGRIVVVNDLDEAVALSNIIAPEHLELAVDAPEALLEKVTNAGSIFLGEYTPEALGDYFAGTNHTLPTSGTARFSSPLSTYDFMKKSAYIKYTAKALASVAEKVEVFAESEGLTAHKNSVTVRKK